MPQGCYQNPPSRDRRSFAEGNWAGHTEDPERLSKPIKAEGKWPAGRAGMPDGNTQGKLLAVGPGQKAASNGAIGS